MQDAVNGVMIGHRKIGDLMIADVCEQLFRGIGTIRIYRMNMQV